MRQPIVISSTARLEQLECRLLFDGVGAAPEAHLMPALVGDSLAPVSVLFVAPDGTDANDGLTPAQPLASIQAATQRLPDIGGTIYVMPGVYDEALYNPKGGTSWDTLVRIAAYDPSDRPILRPPAGASRVIMFASEDSSYIELDGFVLDAVNTEYDAVKISWSTGYGGSHHIRLKNSEVMNAPLQGVLATGHDHGVSHLEFTGLDVHHNGTTRLDHGFYVSTPFTVIERSFVHNNSGWGINNYGGDPSHNVFRDNTISDNNRAGGDAAGIGVYTGNDLQVYNNTIVGHFRGVHVDYNASDVRVIANRIEASETAGILVGYTASEVDVSSNYFVGNAYDLQPMGDNIEFGAVAAYLPGIPEPSLRLDIISGNSATDFLPLARLLNAWDASIVEFTTSGHPHEGTQAEARELANSSAVIQELAYAATPERTQSTFRQSTSRDHLGVDEFLTQLTEELLIGGEVSFGAGGNRYFMELWSIHEHS